MAKRKKNWTFSAGERPHTVTIFERDGNLHARAWDPTRRGGRGDWKRRSLKHNDRAKAKAYAKEQVAKLEKGTAEIMQDDVKLGQVVNLYLL